LNTQYRNLNKSKVSADNGATTNPQCPLQL
jgi:hypothetical protein